MLPFKTSGRHKITYEYIQGYHGCEAIKPNIHFRGVALKLSAKACWVFFCEKVLFQPSCVRSNVAERDKLLNLSFRKITLSVYVRVFFDQG